jgi:hypothetical protein
MQTVTNYEWNVIFHVCNFVTEKFIRVDGDQINVYPTQVKLLVSGVYLGVNPFPTLSYCSMIGYGVPLDLVPKGRTHQG